MRILNLFLKAFGPFTDFDLDLSEGSRGLHVIFGPNEAGKSSSLRALRGLLYGIPAKSSDDFRHDYKKMLIGALIRGEDGTHFEFQRRKGNINTIIGPNGENLGENDLNRFLEGVDARAFESVFGLNHERLTEGGREILKGGGEVGGSIFAAGLGGSGMRKALESLKQDAEALFTRQAQKRAINESLSAYKDAAKEIQESTLRSSAWEEIEQKLSMSKAELADINKAIRDSERDHKRLVRILRSAPIAASYESKRVDLNSLDSAPDLPVDFMERARDAMMKLNTSQRDETVAKEEIARLNEEMKKRPIDDILLIEHRDEISLLKKNLGVTLKAVKDAEGLVANQQHLQNSASDMLKLEWKGRTLDELRGLRPGAALRSRIRKTGEGLLVKNSNDSSLIKTLNKYKRDLISAEEELAALPPAIDTALLRTAVKSALKLGDIDSLAEDSLAIIRRDEKNAEIALKKLGLWKGTADELEKQPLPSRETIERYMESFRRGNEDISTLKMKLKECLEGIVRGKSKIEELRLAGEAPSEADLAVAREKRNAGWNLVVRAWIDGEDIADEQSTYCENETLPSAYKRNVETADELADRLRREAARVERFASLTTEVSAIEKTLSDVSAESETALLHIGNLTSEWSDEWKHLGIDPKSPIEMRAWRDSAEKLLELQAAIRVKKDDVRRVEGKASSARLELKTALEIIGDGSVSDDRPFSSLLDHCQAVMEGNDRRNRIRDELNKKIREMKRAVDDGEKEIEECRRELSILQTDWTNVMEKAGLPRDTLPDEANASLDKMEEMFKKLDEADGLALRINAIKEDEKQFIENVTEAAKKFAPEFSGQKYEAIVNRLDEMLSESIKQTERIKQLEKQLKSSESKREAAERSRTEASLILSELLREAGKERIEELADAGRDSEKRRELIKEISDLEKLLHANTEGTAVEALIQEISENDASEVSTRKENLERHIEEQNGKRDELNRSIAVLEEERKKMDGTGKAAEAADRAQNHLAEIRMRVDRFLRLRTAALILEREIERYRAANQDPILSRAGLLFQALTLGSFASLQTDYAENDKQIIVGVRESGNRVGVEGMSDGACDQLYLALHLAHLYKYLDTNKPFPFIVDDILIRFDDERALAALLALADLSDKTQVLFYTHHARMKEMVSGDDRLKGKVFIHEL